MVFYYIPSFFEARSSALSDSHLGTMMDDDRKENPEKWCSMPDFSLKATT